MTTQYSISRAISGQTGTSLKLFAINGDTVLHTANTVVERTNAKGQYLATFGEVAVIPAGNYTQIHFSSGGIPLSIGDRTFQGADGETATERAAELDTSITNQLTSIGQRTAQITGARLQLVGPVTAAGQISLVVGSDYVEDIDSSLIRTITDAGSTIHDALTAGELEDLVFSASPSSNAASANRISGTVTAVSHAGGITSVTIDIERDAIPAGPYGIDWKYQIWRVEDELITPPIIEGTLVLSWRS